MECGHCGGRCVKKGRCRDGRQKYRCRNCGKYQRESYQKRAWLPDTSDWILRLNGEGCGIANICRLLGIVKGTVLRRMRVLWSGMRQFPNVAPGLTVEVDELCTHVGRRNNKIYVCSAVCRETGAVLAFGVGKRRKEMIGPVIAAVRAMSPQLVCTDGLNLYPGLLRGVLHRVGRRHIRVVESLHLALRTNLKRLQRRSVCFSRTKAMLEASMGLWFHTRGKAVARAVAQPP